MYSSITMQVTTVTQKGQVTIPKSIRRDLGIKTGQKIAFTKKKNEVVIEPVIDFFSLRGSIKSIKPFDIKAWDKAIAKKIASDYAKKEARINRH